MSAPSAPRWHAAAAALSSLLLACPPAPSGNDAGEDAGVEISPIDMCSRLAAASCELLERCFTAFQRQPASACRAEKEARCLAEYEELKPYFTAGNTAIDPEKVRSCEERMKTSFCTPTFPPGYPAVSAHPFADCELTTGLLRGNVASGQTCQHAVECSPGTICVKPGGVCRGTCSALAAQGEPCAFGCAVGLYCEEQGTEDVTDDRCARPKGLDAPCDSSLQCQPDLFCRSGTCRPRGKSGETCLFDADRLSTCEPGLACDVAPFVANQVGTCIIPRGIGQGCNFHWSCLAGLVCSDLGYTGFPQTAPTPGACSPPGAIGSYCPYTPYSRYVGDQCEAGSYCTATGQCTAIPALGQPCTPSSQSCSGLDVFCKPSGSGDTGTCSRPPNIGERCAQRIDDQRVLTIPCASGWCDTVATSSCLAPNKQIGQLCQTDGECVSNRCAVQQDRTLKCAAACL